MMLKAFPDSEDSWLFQLKMSPQTLSGNLVKISFTPLKGGICIGKQMFLPCSLRISLPGSVNLSGHLSLADY